jgi:hypothetical protein
MNLLLEVGESSFLVVFGIVKDHNPYFEETE